MWILKNLKHDDDEDDDSNEDDDDDDDDKCEQLPLPRICLLGVEY